MLFPRVRFVAMVFAVLALGGALPCLGADWPQYLGPSRDGSSPEVPAQLPAQKLLWKVPLGGVEIYAGIVATDKYVVVADHAGEKDVVRCFSTEDGKALWSYAAENNVEMDYGCGPRATPVLCDGLAITFSAVGDIRAFDLATGKAAWQLSCEKNFKGGTPEWGFCNSPLLVDGKLIVSPCGNKAGIVALDPKTGKPLWQTPGGGSPYASFISGTFGGVAQVVGYDGDQLAGWDLATGKRLWSFGVENQGDYNVGTPAKVGDKILFATDNNNARLFAFGAGGKAQEEPAAKNEDLAPDQATPICYEDLVFGAAKSLCCLSADKLETKWSDEKHGGFANLIVGNDRVMVFDDGGKLILLAANGEKCQVLGEVKLCGSTMSYPALAHGKLYIRDAKTLYCYAMK